VTIFFSIVLKSIKTNMCQMDFPSSRTTASSCEPVKVRLVLRAAGVAVRADSTAVRYIGLKARVVGLGVWDDWLLVRTGGMVV
jgi:hypothetical protein